MFILQLPTGPSRVRAGGFRFDGRGCCHRRGLAPRWNRAPGGARNAEPQLGPNPPNPKPRPDRPKNQASPTPRSPHNHHPQPKPNSAKALSPQRDCSGASPLRSIRKRIDLPLWLCRDSSESAVQIQMWAARLRRLYPPNTPRRQPHRLRWGPEYGGDCSCPMGLSSYKPQQSPNTDSPAPKDCTDSSGPHPAASAAPWQDPATVPLAPANKRPFSCRVHQVG